MDKLFTQVQYERMKKEAGLVTYDGSDLIDGDGNAIEVGGGGGETNYYIQGMFEIEEGNTLADILDGKLYSDYNIHLSDLPTATPLKFMGYMQGENGGYAVNNIIVYNSSNVITITINGMNLSSEVCIMIESTVNGDISDETITETIIESTIWLSVPSNE